MSQQPIPSQQQHSPFDEIASLRRELATVHSRLDTLQRRRTPRSLAARGHIRRLMPLLVVALLVALMPLSLLAAGPVFSDLGTAAPVHQPNIQAIGDVGITTGFEDPADPTKRLYNPKDNVTREEMTSFLARTAGLGTNPPVANAKTAQTATNASNAANATTVGGYAPNALLRVDFSVRTSGMGLPLTGSALSLREVSINVPGRATSWSWGTPGFLGRVPAPAPVERPCAIWPPPIPRAPTTTRRSRRRASMVI